MGTTYRPAEPAIVAQLRATITALSAEVAELRAEVAQLRADFADFAVFVGELAEQREQAVT